MAVLRPQPLRILLDDLANVTHAPVDGEVWVSGITHDSRQVQHGDLFVAVPGFQQHGIDFLENAVSSGAVAVASDAHGVRVAQAFGLPTIELTDVRREMALLAAQVYGHPERELTMLGVTGTNGKTTTASMIRHILHNDGISVGMIGTLGTWCGEQHLPGARTTPESTDLFALLGYFREQGITHVVMEVSSHALSLGRVAGITFDVAVFTNLSQDHLDFHATMDHYFEAKASLFEATKHGIINGDDSYGKVLMSRALGSLPLSVVGADSEWTASNIVSDVSGHTSFDVTAPAGSFMGVHIPMFGHFNVTNALCALATVSAIGITIDNAANALQSFAGVPGRCEVIPLLGNATAVVDYAHTPDAVEKILSELKAVNPTQLITVIGCGGDRDPSKRFAMGHIASQLSDVVIVTDDNPRTEDANAIRAEVQRGASNGAAQVRNIGDRRSAIHEALSIAQVGDIVAVLGKGHESGQEVAGVIHPFDDREVIQQESAHA